jgi:uncharacterized Fe-S cluster-containing radical SAM superfamily enzyme
MKDFVRFHFLQNYYFDVRKEALFRIGKFKTQGHSIEFKDLEEKKVSTRFNFIIFNGVKNMTNKINNRKTIYVHRNSGLPLIGCLTFGIVDKGTDMIEIKPLTGCNINCVFCSVGEGIDSKKVVDYLVEEEYLVEELSKLVEYKDHDIQVYINPHGEPVLYPRLLQLVEDISKIKHVKTIAMITNGTLLSEELVDALKEKGLTQINLSMNSFSTDKGKELSGVKFYDINRIKSLAEYINKRMKLVLAPVWIKGVNDADVEGIIQFASKLNVSVGIQKFCYNKGGRNPIKEASWDEFYSILKEWEEKYNISLVFKAETISTKELPKPFKTDDIVNASVICEGRFPNEKLCAAEGRIITLIDCKKDGKVKVNITSDKYNIFTAKCVN